MIFFSLLLEIFRQNIHVNTAKANLESLPVDQKTSAPKGGMLSKKIVGMKPRSTFTYFTTDKIIISGLNLWLTFLLIDTIQFHRNHSYRRSRWAHSDIHFGLYKPFFVVVRIEHSNSRWISKLKLNFVLWHFQKPLMQLFVW